MRRKLLASQASAVVSTDTESVDADYATLERAAHSAYPESWQEPATIRARTKPRNGEISEVELMPVQAKVTAPVAGLPSLRLPRQVAGSAMPGGFDP